MQNNKMTTQLSLRQKIYIIVFKTSTKAGKRFDIILLWLILTSVVCLLLESVPFIGINYGSVLLTIEVFFTIIFSIEYLLRIYISPQPFKYVFSFWGMVDLLSVVPTYLILLRPDLHYLLIIKSLRLLRVFRIIKLAGFITAAELLIEAFRTSIYKISTFLISVLTVVTIMGTLMYIVEGGENGFTSIPQSIYWAIITITTVGYGDIVPHTVIGKFISSIVMVIGYSIIAVPTGLFTVEFMRSSIKKTSCSKCNHKNESTSKFCSNCGNEMDKQ